MSDDLLDAYQRSVDLCDSLLGQWREWSADTATMLACAWTDHEGLRAEVCPPLVSPSTAKLLGERGGYAVAISVNMELLRMAGYDALTLPEPDPADVRARLYRRLCGLQAFMRKVEDLADTSC